MELELVLLIPFFVAAVLSSVAASRNARAPSPGIVSSTLAMVVVVGEVLRSAQGGTAYESPDVSNFRAFGPGLETAWLELLLLAALGFIHGRGLGVARHSGVRVVTTPGVVIGILSTAAVGWMAWCRFQTYRIPEAQIDTFDEVFRFQVWLATSWQSGALIGLVLMFVPFLSLVLGVVLERQRERREQAAGADGG